MTAASHYITIGTEQLHYLQWGTGKRLLLAFHGYGDDAHIFDPLVEFLSADYTVLSIDLPHHGQSKWHGDEMFTKDKLLLLVRTLMEAHKTERVSLLGYSMGGRVCLSIIEGMPLSIDQAVLLATDGLSVNFYYYFFTKTFLGKKVFNHMLEKPGGYLAVIDWMRKRKLVDASRHKFVMHFLQAEHSRKFLQKVWPNTSDLVPSPAQLRKIIKKHSVNVSIFMGTHDKILPPGLATKFAAGLDTVQLHILDKGHRLLDQQTAKQIAEDLL